MKFTHKISRLFGIGTEADPKKNRLSINLTEVAPSLEQQSTPQSELSSPPEHLAFVEKVDITANTRLVEPSNLVTQHDDIENLGVTSRDVVWLFFEQLRSEFVPVFHRLQGRSGCQC